MRQEIEFMRQISRPPREFDAAIFVHAVIDSEIQHLRHRSHQGIFHDYVKRRGYPIPDEIRARTAYSPRIALEAQLSTAIQNKEHVLLLGCEGSGKTTLLHYVVGSEPLHDLHTFLYLDVSDVDVTQRSDFSDILYDKLTNALLTGLGEDKKAKFQEWRVSKLNNLFAEAILDTATPKRLAESVITFLRTEGEGKCIYILIDNIDSVSLPASKALFGALNMLNDSVRAACATLKLEDRQNTRYVITCRTPTYSHISGVSFGLFIDFAHRVISCDDDFLINTDILSLLDRFLKLEHEYIFRNHANRPIHVDIRGATFEMKLDDYISDVFRWMRRSDTVFNSVIKMFCGRSIRRAKLYGIKILANPTIARLALFERFNIVSITRDDQSYLRRRLEEAVFDFSSGGQVQNLGLVGFPLNPFRVSMDDDDYRKNPLIGVVGLGFLKENASGLAREDIFFAHTVDVTALVHHFQSIGYSESGIRSFFSAARDSGLLRPILSSSILIRDSLDYRDVYEMYVLDDRARDSYFNLVFAQDPRLSMIFYNCSLRAHYKVFGDRYIDDALYECYSCLIFLNDLMDREDRLGEMVEGTGVMVATLSSLIRAPMMGLIAKLMEAYSDVGDKRSADISNRRELLSRTRELHRIVRDRIGKRTGIL